MVRKLAPPHVIAAAAGEAYAGVLAHVAEVLPCPPPPLPPAAVARTPAAREELRERGGPAWERLLALEAAVRLARVVDASRLDLLARAWAWFAARDDTEAAGRIADHARVAWGADVAGWEAALAGHRAGGCPDRCWACEAGA